MIDFLFFMSQRGAKAWDPFLFGHPETVVSRVITVHVMVTPAVSTLYPSPAPQRMETSPGTWRCAVPSWPQPTAVESLTKGR